MGLMLSRGTLSMGVGTGSGVLTVWVWVWVVWVCKCSRLGLCPPLGACLGMGSCLGLSSVVRVRMRVRVLVGDTFISVFSGETPQRERIEELPSFRIWIRELAAASPIVSFSLQSTEVRL